MRPPRLLVTGFGPFPGVPINPSATLARRIAASPRLRRVMGTAPELLILTTSYSALSTELEPALAEQPDAVLMIGIARRARCIRIEGRAVNRASRLFPDASGKVARQLTLDLDGPHERRSAIAAQLRIPLRRVGAIASRDAGRYLCNASYYRVLSEGCPAIFLHIPPLPDLSRRSGSHRIRRRRPLDAWTDAIVESALVLLVRARRDARPRRGEGAFMPSGGAAPR
ncbi:MULTISPECIES: pyroglutamyl-peptidase I family protein [Methylobacterium]|uniref:Pyrrolidone-carboxylate peptidase n=1 Tax=Methylobacterium thuringiense TaxID=1003091 RepID=A0ABQ4TV48_9HYPH|nr:MULTISPECIES: peptidase C15 [Methylobacterium]TXN24392.1 peptidase C15 [Methylobacterium sp. WL9]GJE57817.1 Pyrrolidone-carboxylate peptidase [Methylobacterium thuringiense]